MLSRPSLQHLIYLYKIKSALLNVIDSIPEMNKINKTIQCKKTGFYKGIYFHKPALKVHSGQCNVYQFFFRLDHSCFFFS